MSSRFYRIDPDDPDAPIVLSRYNCGHGEIRPGRPVRYENPDAPPLPAGELILTELLAFGPRVLAILNDGEYEVSADNLHPIPEPEATP
jgi:hypothetical protein